MSEKSRSEIVLEYVKALTWPIFIVIGILWLGKDVKEILNNRTWKIGVIEVGNRIETLEVSLQEQLLAQEDSINLILENSTNSEKVEEYARQTLTSINNARKGIKREVENIQEGVSQRPGSNATPEPINPKNPNTAQGWENLGFKSIIDREIDPAINAFTESEKIWPIYHNVSEIRKLLIQNQKSLNTKEAPKWKEIYEIILKKYSWGMPTQVQQKLKTYISS